MSRLRVSFLDVVVLPCLGLSVALAICGCSSLEVKLGKRVSLANVPVVAIQARLPEGGGIAPGEKTPLIATVTDSAGNMLVTEGQGKGKVLWKDLSVTATTVSVNSKGVVSLAGDPRLTDGKTGHVTIAVRSHPGIQTELDVPLRYNYPFITSFSGASGFSGLDGANGSDGSSGSSGSLDPAAPSPGGNGGNGTNGSDGADGKDGDDCPPIQVRVMLRAGERPLLEVGVSTSARNEKYFLVDPEGGTLTVRSLGGSGGMGGRGGRGGRGGSGGVGTPSGSNGSDGQNGHDGRRGSDGRPGPVTVIYDPQAKAYLDAIVVSNAGGPKAVFLEQTVPPLW